MHPGAGETVVTVFGSAFPKQGSEEYKLARKLGGMLAEAGWIICNGGYGGTMEASARGAKEAGGMTIGVLTEAFGTEPNRYIDSTIVLRSPVERLLKLIELGNAYVVLPGGTGTLVELATVWEYMNKGVVGEKPIVALGSFWDAVIRTMSEELMREGKTGAARLAIVVPSPRECVAALQRLLKRT